MSTTLSGEKKPGVGNQIELFNRRVAGYCEPRHHNLRHNHLISPGTGKFWICVKCGFKTDYFEHHDFALSLPSL